MKCGELELQQTSIAYANTSSILEAHITNKNRNNITKIDIQYMYATNKNRRKILSFNSKEIRRACISFFDWFSKQHRKTLLIFFWSFSNT